MDTPKRLVVVTIVASILFALATLMLPLKSSQPGLPIWMSHSFMIISMIMTVLYVGGAIIFLCGLSGFTPKFKRAYGIMCAGIIIFGLAQIQVPFVQGFGLMHIPYVAYGFIALPYLAGIYLLFTGLRSFAHLLGIRGKWTSIWWITFLGILAAIGTTFLPHLPSTTPDVILKSSLALSTLGQIIIMGAAWLVLLIKRTASSLYTNSMAWMFMALLGLIAHAVYYAIMLLLVGVYHWSVQSGFSMILYIPAGLLLVRAAYAFNQISDQEAIVDDAPRNFFGHRIGETTGARSTGLDIVMFAATLVSNPQAVESTMNNVRQVTARLAPGEAPTAQDEAVFKETYYKIEAYLTKQEPIRRFSQEALRQHIQRKLHLQASSAKSFWNSASS